MDPDQTPRARREGLLSERIGHELLVYDTRNNVAHCLSPVASEVWEACDGQHDVDAEALLTGCSAAAVHAALTELTGAGLLQTPSPERRPRVSRGDALKQFAAVGAAAGTAPLIVSREINPAAAFASGGTGALGSTCTVFNSETDSCEANAYCANGYCIPENCVPSDCTSGPCSLGTVVGGTCETMYSMTLCCQ